MRSRGRLRSRRLSGTVTITGEARITTSGGLNILDGIVVHVAAGNLGTSNITLGAASTSGTFEYQGASATRGGTFGVNAGGGTVRVTDAASTLTLSGVVSGAGALTKDGAGTLAFTNANNYSGGTTVTAGTLQLGSGGTTGSIAGDATIQSGATLAFNRSDNTSFATNTNGAGNIVKLGANTLTLTGTLGHTGTTTVSAGTLRITPQTLGGGLNVAAGATLTSVNSATPATLTASTAILLPRGQRSDLNWTPRALTTPERRLRTGSISTAELTLLVTSTAVSRWNFHNRRLRGTPISSGFNLARRRGPSAASSLTPQHESISKSPVSIQQWTRVRSGPRTGTAINVGGTQRVEVGQRQHRENFVAGDVEFDDTTSVSTLTSPRSCAHQRQSTPQYLRLRLGSITGSAALDQTRDRYSDWRRTTTTPD